MKSHRFGKKKGYENLSCEKLSKRIDEIDVQIRKFKRERVLLVAAYKTRLEVEKEKLAKERDRDDHYYGARPSAHEDLR